jgi:ATP-dependent RNA helicase DeaD
MYSGPIQAETFPELDNEDEDEPLDNEMVRLFINIGSENKIQPRHIIESIASTSGLPGKLVGAINIYDRYTFVEVPKKYAHEVLESMKNATMKGRRINIEKSNKKPDKKRRTRKRE